MEGFRKLWKYLFKIGLSVAAFKLDSDDSLLDLIGVNVLFPVTEEINKVLEDSTVTYSLYLFMVIRHYKNLLDAILDDKSFFIKMRLKNF